MQVSHELLALSLAAESLLDAYHDGLECFSVLNKVLSPSLVFDIRQNMILNDSASV